MNSSTGRWVSDDDFFDRERELRILETRVREGLVGVAFPRSSHTSRKSSF